MEPAPQQRTLFADLDGQSRELTAMLIAALQQMARHPQIRRVRQTGWDLLRPAAGQRLLDAGSGVGEMARRLAGQVDEVIAVDYSAAITAAAIERHDGSPVRYVAGDVRALDLPDNSVDGVWCERVLQHLDDPDQAIAELIRVTRPGGRLCLIDTDWASLAFDGVPAQISAEVVTSMHGRLTPRQRDLGRTLRRRLLSAGLTEVTAIPVTCLFTDPTSAAVVLPMVNPAIPVADWTTPPGVRERWFALVDAAGARGDFLAVLTIWVVAGAV